MGPCYPCGWGCRGGTGDGECGEDGGKGGLFSQDWRRIQPRRHYGQNKNSFFFDKINSVQLEYQQTIILYYTYGQRVARARARARARGRDKARTRARGRAGWARVRYRFSCQYFSYRIEELIA